MTKKIQSQTHMAAYATPNAAVAADPRLRLLGVPIRGVMEEFLFVPEFHAPLLAVLDTLGSAWASLCRPSSLLETAFMPCSMSQRSSQVGGHSRDRWRSILDFTQDPETDVLDWLHSGAPS